ncbi:MAG: hypothetical protein K2X27_07350, partial [Candidatus Obscuribacterales bacterium]|nr:hypothetical protein [Candidatus Obscuribacterales bacterium]
MRPLTLLGLAPTADLPAINAAFERLSNSFSPARFENARATEQAANAFVHIRQAHTVLQDDSFRAQHSVDCNEHPEPYSPGQLKPFLGHVCVAAGIISYQDLLDAIKDQTDIDLPLGQILQ